MANKAYSLSHTKWMCKYHIVFTPKYRRKAIYGQIRSDIGEILRRLCEYKGVEIIEGHLMPDHVHMLLAIPPKYSVSSVMGYLKGKSSLMIFDKHANLKYKFGNRRFWAEGYYVSTVGLNEATIAKYIREQEAADIALRYERYVKGALSFFNHQSNVGFENRITNVDFKDLSQNMRVFGMLTALEAVRNRMYANFERGVTTWLYIDEVQSLFGHPAIISYFSKFWAEGRKFNLIATGITQNSVYMLDHEEARNMVLNSDFVLLHKQSHLDRKQSPLDRRAWAELLDMSAQEASYIDESVRAGEGLLIAGGARVPLKDDFPKGKLYELFNTKPEEIAQIKRAQAFARAREGGDA